MRIVVLMRQLPDLVEELEVVAAGTDIDREFVKFVSNEWDEAALEEALLLKEASASDEVVVVALDEPEVDQTLYTAIAKGADRAVKLTGLPAERWLSTRERADLLAPVVSEIGADLVLTGVQAADDLDGQLAGILAGVLGMPHAAVVVRVEAKDASVRVTQELGGGRSVDEEIALPVLLGIQTAGQAPRYAAISRIRQAMQAGGIEERVVTVPPEDRKATTLRRLYAPEQTGHAEMLSGAPEEVAGQIVELLRARGLVKA
ncbi:MAG: electron transfer flavoprotein subunit beta/FixA family protein [Acidimicrobiales bacterium]